MPRVSHLPRRTCCGCHAPDLQAALVRLAIDDRGVLVIDRARLRGGRGAYLHRRPPCWEGFLRGRPHVRSLRRIVPVAQRVEVIEELRALHSDGDDTGPSRTAPTGPGAARRTCAEAERVERRCEFTS